MNAAKIDRLIEQRNKLLQRRDGLYDHERVNRIDAKLRSAVAPGQRKDVDLLLGRVLPSYAVRWSSDSERAETKERGEAEAARLAEEKRGAFDAEMRRLCRDYDIEAPTYDGMWK